MWLVSEGIELSEVFATSKLHQLEMGPDQSRTYFWPTVNKGQTRLWPLYFLTQTENILFDPKGKKLKSLGFLVEIFQTQPNLIQTPKKNDVSQPGPITNSNPV